MAALIFYLINDTGWLILVYTQARRIPVVES